LITKPDAFGSVYHSRPNGSSSEIKINAAMVLDRGSYSRRNSRGRKAADYTNRTCADNTQRRTRKRDYPCNHIGYHTEGNTHVGNPTHSTRYMRLASPRARPLSQELPACL
jgi:hypothetical protein